MSSISRDNILHFLQERPYALSGNLQKVKKVE